jgi:6-phosphogluconolactonase (cycloisomerase 2 family)
MTSLIVASFHNRPQVLHFDPVRGEITLETLSKPDFDGYTWISAHPKHDGLFYALQRFSDAEGILSVIKIPTKTNTSDTGKHVTELKILKNYPSHGMDPCHLGVSPQGDSLAIANVNTSLSSATLSESAKERIIRQYDTSTVTIYKLDQDGMVDENVKPEIIDLSKEPFKTGPNAERQEAAHPHGCFYVPMLETYLVPDLGADKLRLIDKGKTLPCKAGAGPRHAVIHPQGRFRA